MGDLYGVQTLFPWVPESELRPTHDHGYAGSVPMHEYRARTE